MAINLIPFDNYEGRIVNFGSQADDYPGDNALDFRPSKTWRTKTFTWNYFNVDFGRSMDFDTVVILNTNGESATGGSVKLYSSDTQYSFYFWPDYGTLLGTFSFNDLASILYFTSQNHRYYHITITLTGISYFEAGYIGFGKKNVLNGYFTERSITYTDQSEKTISPHHLQALGDNGALIRRENLSFSGMVLSQLEAIKECLSPDAEYDRYYDSGIVDFLGTGLEITEIVFFVLESLAILQTTSADKQQRYNAKFDVIEQYWKDLTVDLTEYFVLGRDVDASGVEYGDETDGLGCGETGAGNESIGGNLIELGDE